MHPHLDEPLDPTVNGSGTENGIQPGIPDDEVPEGHAATDELERAPDVAAAEEVADAAEPEAATIERETTIEPEAATEPETTIEPEAAAEPEPMSEPSAMAEPETEPEAEAAPGAMAEPETEPEAVAAPTPRAEPSAEAAPTTEPELEPAPEPDATAESEPGGPASAEPAAPSDEPVPEPALPTTVAELVAATLRAAGVRLAFTVPGESFLPVLDALDAAGIRVVATRHEGAAAFAAEAYGQLTGRPAVCLGTRAVGAANLAIGIHTATADSTPMFALVGQVDRALRGREAFQEIDLVGTIGRMAKWAGEIEDAETATATLEAAVRATVEGRPGPALIALPEDVLTLPLPEATRPPVVRVHPEVPAASDVRAVLHLLAAAERPVIVAGAGVLRARCSNDLVRFAELLHVPVIAAWRRGDVIPNDHPLYLGMAGYGSPAVVGERIRAADALLVIGSRLGEVTTAGYGFPAAGQRWMHVDLEPRSAAVGGSPAPELAIRTDARAFLRAAVGRLKDAVLVAAPVAARDGHNGADRAAWEAASVVDETGWDGPGVHPGRIVADLRRLLPDDSILTTDAGAFGGWAARGFRFRRPGTFLGPTSGAMGYGFPAALAAALVHRERRVVALLGDGGMGMTLAEIETAVREGAHVVAIVFDNEQYGMIHLHQVREGSPATPGTNLGPIDFAAAARACGARGVRVDTDAAFEPALRTALAASGPTVIQLVLDRRWQSVDNPASSS